MGKRAIASKELKKIYKDAWEKGIWLREFTADKGFLVAAGSVKELKRTEKRVGKKIEINKLTLGDCVLLFNAVPGIGNTREMACEVALRAFKKYYRQTQNGWVPK